MLEIQEKFDTQGYEEIIAVAGTDNIHITEAMDNGKSTGYIAYVYEPECTVVYGYDDGGDLMLCDGLVRSVMFKSVLKGIGTMIFKLHDTNGFINLRKLKFLEDNSTVCENLDRFMNACQNCRRGEI
ncbi:MAG: hypothetical protein K2N49_04105 [Ruminococcus sp.]|nr:hypothetical protein [Ruminococcus sp.]MDE7226025.1 hypothetical protein [Ruminococcus sp.]